LDEWVSPSGVILDFSFLAYCCSPQLNLGEKKKKNFCKGTESPSKGLSLKSCVGSKRVSQWDCFLFPSFLFYFFDLINFICFLIRIVNKSLGCDIKTCVVEHFRSWNNTNTLPHRITSLLIPFIINCGSFISCIETLS
jgi:hypothetical protein